MRDVRRSQFGGFDKPLSSIFNKFSQDEPSEVNAALDELDRYVGAVLGKVPSSKMRNIYAVIKSASNQKDTNSKLRELAYFRYKMAYIAARDNNLKRFASDMSKIITELVDKKKELLDKFFIFCEAIVAYHKKYARTGG